MSVECPDGDLMHINVPAHFRCFAFPDHQVGRTKMTLQSMLVIGAVVAAFALFIIVLAWSDLRTRSERKPDDAERSGDSVSSPVPQ